MRTIWLLIASFGMAIAISGCSSFGGLLEQKPVDPLYTYKADIILGLGSNYYDGFSWTEIQPKQVINIQSKATLNLLQISSCHRTFSVENVDKDWFGGVGHTYNYTYEPTELEKKGFCPLYFQAFDKEGSTGWGFMAFKSEERLELNLQCNGRSRDLLGVGVCQSQINQIQALAFKEEVKLTWSQECKVEVQDSKNYVVASKGGFCVMTARALADKEKYARILVLGYKHQHVR